MSIKDKLKHIGSELKNHAPFTIVGALTGIGLMIFFRDLSEKHSGVLFAIFHPGHVLLSAMVTASLFQLHRKARQFILILIIGYVGSIGVATLSDCIVPFFGESILGVSIPTHAALHENSEESVKMDEQTTEQDHDGHEHDAEDRFIDEHGHEHPMLHLGFIEEWYIVNPAALIGILIAFFLPRTKYPHGFHVLVSTWASMAHIMMNTRADITFVIAIGIFIVLFIAVWIPCCVSDIVFPLLFVDSSEKHDGCWLCKDGHEHDNPGEQS